MLILVVRTDKPEAEIGLFDNTTNLAYETWQAHRALAETLHGKIRDMLTNEQKNWHDIEGIVAFKGPGSFTGLRIGLTVANALAYSLQVPIIAAAGDDEWIHEGIEKLLQGENEQLALPEYGAPVHITLPKK